MSSNPTQFDDEEPPDYSPQASNRWYVRKRASEEGVDPDFAERIAKRESGFNSRATSNQGANGVMQLVTGTAKRYGVKDPYDAKQNIDGGISYLRDLGHMFGGDQRRIAAGYHAGEHDADAALANPRGNPKTNAYVNAVAGPAPRATAAGDDEPPDYTVAPTTAAPASSGPKIVQPNNRGRYGFSQDDLASPNKPAPAAPQRIATTQPARTAPPTGRPASDTEMGLQSAFEDAKRRGDLDKAGEYGSRLQHEFGWSVRYDRDPQRNISWPSITPPAGVSAEIHPGQGATQFANEELARTRLPNQQAENAKRIRAAAPAEKKRIAIETAKQRPLTEEEQAAAGFDPLEKTILNVAAPLTGLVGRTLTGIGREAEAVAPYIGYSPAQREGTVGAGYSSPVRRIGENVTSASQAAENLVNQSGPARFARGLVGTAPLLALPEGITPLVMQQYLEARGSGADHATAIKHAAAATAGLVGGGAGGHALEAEIESTVGRYLARSAGLGAGMEASSLALGEPQTPEAIGERLGTAGVFGLHGNQRISKQSKAANEAAERATSQAEQLQAQTENIKRIGQEAQGLVNENANQRLLQQWQARKEYEAQRVAEEQAQPRLVKQPVEKGFDVARGPEETGFEVNPLPGEAFPVESPDRALRPQPEQRGFEVNPLVGEALPAEGPERAPRPAPPRAEREKSLRERFEEQQQARRDYETQRVEEENAPPPKLIKTDKYFIANRDGSLVPAKRGQKPPKFTALIKRTVDGTLSVENSNGMRDGTALDIARRNQKTITRESTGETGASPVEESAPASVEVQPQAPAAPTSEREQIASQTEELRRREAEQRGDIGLGPEDFGIPPGGGPLRPGERTSAAESARLYPEVTPEQRTTVESMLDRRRSQQPRSSALPERRVEEKGLEPREREPMTRDQYDAEYQRLDDLIKNAGGNQIAARHARNQQVELQKAWLRQKNRPISVGEYKQLRGLGYAGDEISRMKPAEAREALATAAERQPAQPQYAYRMRDVGETGISARADHPQAGVDEARVRSYGESRGRTQGKPQEMIKVDLSRLNPADYELRESGGITNVLFKKDVPESLIERHSAEARPEPFAETGRYGMKPEHRAEVDKFKEASTEAERMAVEARNNIGKINDETRTEEDTATEAPREFSSTQVNLPPADAKKVTELAAKIPDSALTGDGREENPHVTVKYGLHGHDAEEVRQVLADEGPIKIKLGKTSIFPADEATTQRGAAEHDVVKIDVDSPDLHRLNKKIADALPHTDTHPEYKPHVTLAYVKPGEGKNYAGDSSLEGHEITLDRIVFSGKDRTETHIPLKGNTAESTIPESKPKASSKKSKQIEDQTLSQFVRARRGFKADSDLQGELDRLRSKESGTSGLFTKDGLSPDRMREAAVEAGFFSPDDPQAQNVGDFIAAVEADAAKPGSHRHPGYDYVDEIEREASLLGAGLDFVDKEDGNILYKKALKDDDWLNAFEKVIDDGKEPTKRQLKEFRKLSRELGVSDQAIDRIIASGEYGRSSESVEFPPREEAHLASDEGSAPGEGARAEERAAGEQPPAVESTPEPTPSSEDQPYYSAERTVGDRKEGGGFPGKFWTTDVQVAKNYSGGKGEIATETLQIEKPLRITTGDKEFPEIATANELNAQMRAAGVNFKFADAGDQEVWRYLDDAGKPLADAIRKVGYDALVFPDQQGDRSFETTVTLPEKPTRKTKTLREKAAEQKETRVTGLLTKLRELESSGNKAQAGRIVGELKKLGVTPERIRGERPTPTVPPAANENAVEPTPNHQLSTTDIDRVKAIEESLHERGESVDEYLRQGTLGGTERLSAQQEDLLREMAASRSKRRAPNKTEQGGLYAEGINPTLESRIADQERQQLPGVTGGLFGNRPVEADQKIEDFGEKIGGARKDTAVNSGERQSKEPESEEPGWKKRFKVSEITASNKPDEIGKFAIYDTRKTDWKGQPRQIGKLFDSREAAEKGVEIAAMARNHDVYMGRPDSEGNSKYTIWRKVTDRKRVQVVKQEFDTRDEALNYMANHAAKIIETKTNFGEEILARPEKVFRKGAERRTGPATKEMFGNEFGFRGVEFGNWNNQAERQEVMDHAYDALHDLADMLGVPPKALSLNGELALAFGARGQGLSGAKAHYERDYGVINLTKMSGAGSLAHEWFHAFDHYLARQDTKASSVKKPNARGDLVYPAGSRDRDFASHGFSAQNSKVREEIRAAYKELIQTMFAKAEKYVEDTKRAEDFVGSARDALAKTLNAIRDNSYSGLSKELNNRYRSRNLKAANAEQLAEFDELAKRLIAGEDLKTEFRSTAAPGTPAGARGGMAGRRTNDTLEAMSAIIKNVRGRSGFNAESKGVLDDVRRAMSHYQQRIEMLRSANEGETKTKAVPTSYAMEAKKIDQGRASDYWTTEHEMAARAFSAYVEDKAAEQGNRSDFLAFGSDNKFYRLFDIQPFPEGAERQSINAAFDRFFMKARERELRADLKQQISETLKKERGSGGPSTELLGLYVKLGASYVREGVRDVADFVKRLREHLGETRFNVMLDHIGVPALWRQAQAAAAKGSETADEIRGQIVSHPDHGDLTVHHEFEDGRMKTTDAGGNTRFVAKAEVTGAGQKRESIPTSSAQSTVPVTPASESGSIWENLQASKRGGPENGRSRESGPPAERHTEAQNDEYLKAVLGALGRSKPGEKKAGRREPPILGTLKDQVGVLYSEAMGQGLSGNDLTQFVRRKLIDFVGEGPEFAESTTPRRREALNRLKSSADVERWIQWFGKQQKKADVAEAVMKDKQSIADERNQRLIENDTRLPADLKRTIIAKAESFRDPKISRDSQGRLFSGFLSRVSTMARSYGKAGGELVNRLTDGDVERSHIVEVGSQWLNAINDVYRKIKSPFETQAINDAVINALENRAESEKHLDTDAKKAVYEQAVTMLDYFKGELKKKGYEVLDDYFTHMRDVDVMDQLFGDVKDPRKEKQRSLNQFISDKSPYLEHREGHDLQINRNVPQVLWSYLKSVSRELAYHDAVDYYYTRFQHDIPTGLARNSLDRAMATMRNSLEPDKGTGLGFRAANYIRKQLYRSFLGFNLKAAATNYTQVEFAKLRWTPEANKIRKQAQRSVITGPLADAIDLASRETPRFLEMFKQEGPSKEGAVERTFNRFDPFQRSESHNWRATELGSIINSVIKRPEWKATKGKDVVARLNELLSNKDVFDAAVREAAVTAGHTQVASNPAMRGQMYDSPAARLLLMFTAFKARQLQVLGNAFGRQEGINGARSQAILQRGLTEDATPVEVLRDVETTRKSVEELLKQAKQHNQDLGVPHDAVQQYADYLKSQEAELNQVIKEREPLGGSTTRRALLTGRYLGMVASIAIANKVLWNTINGAVNQKDKKKDAIVPGVPFDAKDALSVGLDVSPIPFFNFNPADATQSPLLPELEFMRYGELTPRQGLKGAVEYATRLIPYAGVVNRGTGNRLSKELVDTVAPKRIGGGSSSPYGSQSGLAYGRQSGSAYGRR